MGTRNGQVWVFDTGIRIRAKNIRGEGPWRVSRAVIKDQFPWRKSVVKIIAGGETSPLRETKEANSCYLLHWYVLWLSSAPGVDYNSGPPGVGKKTQSALLCQDFGFQQVSLDDVLHEVTNDQTYLHVGFVKDCLRENIDLPIQLKISLLERKINEGIEKGKKWSLVHGFPKTMKEVLEFEEKARLITNKQNLSYI